MIQKAYFSLVVRFDEFDQWSIQFGDYDRETVQQEATEYEGGCYAVKIIKTADTQASIDEKVEKLNSLLEV